MHSQKNKYAFNLDLTHIFLIFIQGEYIAPEKIEIAYMRSQYAAQVFIEGDSLKVCVSLL